MYRLREQNREPRNKRLHRWLTDFWQGEKTNEERTVFSTNGAGRTRYPHAKEQSWTLT